MAQESSIVFYPTDIPIRMHKKVDHFFKKDILKDFQILFPRFSKIFKNNYCIVIPADQYFILQGDPIGTKKSAQKE